MPKTTPAPTRTFADDPEVQAIRALIAVDRAKAGHMCALYESTGIWPDDADTASQRAYDDCNAMRARIAAQPVTGWQDIVRRAEALRADHDIREFVNGNLDSPDTTATSEELAALVKAIVQLGERTQHA